MEKKQIIRLWKQYHVPKHIIKHMKKVAEVCKKIGNKFLSFITSMRCGEKITDSQSGFRAYSQKVLKSILHISADYSWASEILMRIMNSEFRCVEVPIKTIYMKKRIKGTGMIDGIKILMNMLKHKQEKQGI